MKKEMKREVEDALEILNGLISNYNDFFIPNCFFIKSHVVRAYWKSIYSTPK